MWAVLNSRSARPRPIIERSQRIIVVRRSPKPVRKARWTKNHTSHPGKPLRRTLRTLAMARNRPMVATLPRSRYLNGTGSSPCVPTPDRVGGVEASLHGDLGDAREVVDASPCRRWRTPRDARAAMRSGSTAMRPARSSSAPLASASLAASGRRLDAGRPDRRAGLDPRRRCRRRRPRRRRARRRRRPGRSSAARRRAVAAPWWPSRRADRRRWRAVPCRRRAAAPAPTPDRTVRNSPFRQRTASSRTCPASSTPVGPAPTMTIVSHCSRSAGSVVHLGHLEGAEDPPAQLHGVVDRLHARRVAGQLVVAEVRLWHAGGDDEAVVGDLEVAEVGGRRWRARSGGRGRSRSPRPARRGRSCTAGRRAGSAARSAPARACPWRPGTAAAGTGGGCGGRRG